MVPPCVVIKVGATALSKRFAVSDNAQYNAGMAAGLIDFSLGSVESRSTAFGARRCRKRKLNHLDRRPPESRGNSRPLFVFLMRKKNME